MAFESHLRITFPPTSAVTVQSPPKNSRYSHRARQYLTQEARALNSPTMQPYVHNRIDAPCQQRYLFRAASFLSRGKHDFVTINGQTRQGDHDRDIFDVKNIRLARQQVSKHLSWQHHRAEVVLTSWSSSLVFVLVHAWLMQDRSSRGNTVKDEDILVYIMDMQLVQDLNKGKHDVHEHHQIHSAQKLISWFRPSLERSDLYDMEYLVSGKLDSSPTSTIFDSVTLKQLKDAGLEVLIPELFKIERSKHLATEYQGTMEKLFRSVQFVQEHELSAASDISKLFKIQFKIPMQVALISLRRRYLDVGQDALLSRLIRHIQDHKGRLDDIKPKIIDGLHPVKPGDSGVPDADQIMILWRWIFQYRYINVDQQDPNRGLETIQVNPRPQSSEDAFEGQLNVKFRVESSIVTGVKRLDDKGTIDDVEIEHEHTASDSQVPQATGPMQHWEDDCSPTQPSSGGATIIPLTSQALPQAAQVVLGFGVEAAKEMVAMLQLFLDDTEKERLRLYDEALQQAGGLLPVLGPPPLGLLDSSDPFDPSIVAVGTQRPSLKRKR
ncbi:hypothetical protein KVT40_009243 [Elsinoe batatas]|uniref:Uncharacterized protein n=1 Tax=Elsinoe batatas TaxID=2601811 RepID=A0A8K0KVT9_9PEZI|nr:hypothetical protein KVT40_009243 [Elsinoe batatas]